MQHFRTEIKIDRAGASLSLKDNVLTTGSCFSDAIGNKLAESKFNVLINPFGTTYNPYSIHKSLRTALKKVYPADQTYFQNNGLYSHYDFHSEFSDPKKDVVDQKIRTIISITHDFLKTANWIIITYGTAWVYTQTSSNEIVANCHKVPLSNFKKEIVSEKKILESFEGFYQDLKSINPTCKVILTVSPVRHIKDTLQLNSLSKSVLRVACQTITETHPDVLYFPAYEIMLDDLRDYRFYKTDMLHPSADAEEYIWNKFSEYLFEDSAKEFLKKWRSIYSALQHRPFHLQSEAHQNFISKLISELEELNKTVNVEKEIASLKSQQNHA